MSMCKMFNPVPTGDAMQTKARLYIVITRGSTTL